MESKATSNILPLKVNFFRGEDEESVMRFMADSESELELITVYKNGPYIVGWFKEGNKKTWQMQQNTLDKSRSTRTKKS